MLRLYILGNVLKEIKKRARRKPDKEQDKRDKFLFSLWEGTGGGACWKVINGFR